MNYKTGYIFITIPQGTSVPNGFYSDEALRAVTVRYSNMDIAQIEISGKFFRPGVTQILKFIRSDAIPGIDYVRALKEGCQACFPEAAIAVVGSNGFGAPIEICFSDDYEKNTAEYMVTAISAWLGDHFIKQLDHFRTTKVGFEHY